MEDIKALLKRAEAADKHRDAMAPVMREAYRYAMPERDGWNSYGVGENLHTYVYDSAGVASMNRFANRLQSTAFPMGQKWASFGLPPHLANGPNAQEVQALLEEVTNIVFQHVHDSNFDAECNPFCYDIGAGVGVMLVESARYAHRRYSGPMLRHQALPPAKVSFDEGPFGTVEGVFLSQSMPGRNLRRTYPDAKIPREMADKIEQSPEDDITLLLADTYDPDRDNWRVQLIDRTSETRLVDRRYRTNPLIVVRWSKAAGERYGRGALLQALPDIRTANKLMELMLIAGGFDATPTFTGMDDGVLNPDTVQIIPGVVIPVRSNGGPMGPSLRALERPTRLEFSEGLLSRMNTQVRQLLFDNPLPPEVQVGLTATEIIERMRLFQQDTGSFGRIHHDAVVPLMMRWIDILEESGAFPPERFRNLFKLVRGSNVRVRAISPLARAQDQADVQSIMAMAAGAASLGEFGARMLMAGLDPDKAGRFIAMRAAVPAELIPTEAQTAERLRAAAQAQQDAALAQSPALAQVAGAVAGGVVQQATQQPEEAAP